MSTESGSTGKKRAEKGRNKNEINGKRRTESLRVRALGMEELRRKKWSSIKNFINKFNCKSYMQIIKSHKDLKVYQHNWRKRPLVPHLKR